MFSKSRLSNDMRMFHDRKMKKKSPNGPRTNPGKILLNIEKLDKFVNLTNSQQTNVKVGCLRLAIKNWSKCKESWASNHLNVPLCM